MSWGKVAAVVGILTTLVVVGVVTGAFRSVPWAAEPVALTVVYTAPTSVDASVVLPEPVQSSLRTIGAAHHAIRLVRVDATGDVTSKTIDMAPRVKGSDPHSDPLVDPSRIGAELVKKISAITGEVNSVDATGGHALYAGLTRASFDDAPVLILSSGLDTSSPDDLRALKWAVPAATVVDNVKRAGELAALPAQPVTFVVLPNAPAQPQLRAVHHAYVKSIWTALLTASGATSVTFLDAIAATPTAAPVADAPTSPIVPLTALPGSPIPVVTLPPPPPGQPQQAQCTVPGALFIVDRAVLTAEQDTIEKLRSCVETALKVPGSTFQLDGWTSTDVIPVVDDPGNKELSRLRTVTIANLLVDHLGVPRDRITRMTAHGNIGQPFPNDPKSPSNRVVRITITFPKN